MRPNSQSTATLDDGRLLLSGGMPFFTPDFSHREDFFFFLFGSSIRILQSRRVDLFSRFFCVSVCVCVLND